MLAIQKIRDEHRSISAVLHGLKQLARDAQDPRVKPGFEALRAMIRYIDEYPERLHHPKEDEYLFARLEARAPQAKPLVAALKAEHQDGARLVRDLERALVFFEEGWPVGAREFLEAVDAYAEFHWKHMRKEESELLPLAEKHLAPEDWRAINAAFDVNQDPIAGIRERDFEALFSKIVNLAPAPLGFGERWRKSGG
jgi:branched-chain amino acid transport system ATP-binding protein